MRFGNAGGYMQLNILLVEDEALHAMAMERALIKLGHRVAGIARDGEQALSLSSSLNPDLVLMDVHLPGIDGIETAKRINQARPTPVVIASSYTDAELAERAARARVYAYLVKPVTEQVLGPTLESAIKNYQVENAMEMQLHSLQNELARRKNHSRAIGYLMDSMGLSETAAEQELNRRSGIKGVSPRHMAARICRRLDLNKKQPAKGFDA
jgi:AmiR/NasT family two-component response regulator